MKKRQTINEQKTDNLEQVVSREIMRIRRETLEINQLLSKPTLSTADVKRLRLLFLGDATDGLSNLSNLDWKELLEARVVLCSDEQKLFELANKLCTA